MKRRKWQKAAALIACVAMVGTETPNITNIVNGSSFEDGTEADFICDEKTESVDFISDLPSGDEVSQDENCGDVGFAGVAATEGENENPVAENPDTESPVEEKVVHTAPIARVLLDNVTGNTDMKYQWIHVTSNVSQGEGNAKVCLTLTEPEGKAPVTKVKTALFAKQPEDFATAEITEWAQLNTPVILENACNGSEKLNVNYVQDYEKNESGEYITDENGNLTVTAAYLEYEVPAGSSTDFYAVFAYSQEEETYTYEAELNAQATWEADGEETDILEKEEKNQIRFTLEKKAEDTEKDAEVEGAEKDAEAEGAEKDTEAEGAEKDTEAEDTQKGAGDEAAKEENTSGDGTIRDDVENVSEDSDKEALVQISLTKELEDESQTAEEAQNEENSDEQVNENPDPVVEETAVSGQAYAVHVTAQDLHQDSGDDITVRLNMKDTDTGLPLQGISTSFGKTKEEALSGAGADTAQIPEGLMGQELVVSRVQESTEDDNGNAQLTSDYISFQLPAGGTADFYVGITYTAQEEEYERNLAIEAQAQQLITEEGGETAEGDRQTAEENEGSCQASADTENINAANMLPSLPGALTTEVGEDIAEAGADEAAALNDVSEPEGEGSQPVEENSQPEETPSESTEEKKLVNVLNGTAAVMLAWAARSGGGNRTLQAGDWLYFDVTNSNNWEKDSAVITFRYWKNNQWNRVSMDKCEEEHRYRVKLTAEMVDGGGFKFTRDNPETLDAWNWMPDNNDIKLKYNENNNSNLYKATSFQAGTWSEEWITTNYAGEKLYFINLQQGAAQETAQETVTACFSGTGGSKIVPNDIAMTADLSFPGLYSVTIPSDADYDTVTFKNGGKEYATKSIVDGDYNPDSTNTFYYGASEIGSGESKITYSAWDTLPGNESIAGKKLYLDNADTAFPISSSTASAVTIQIGTEAPVPLQVDTESNMYLYTVPENSDATQRTLITLTAGTNTYRLLWSNIKKNKVTVTDYIAGVTGKYRNGYTVYYDATLSKLSYYNNSNDVCNNGMGIPYDDDSSKVYYYAVDANGNSEAKEMSPVDGSNRNLWSVDLSPENGGAEYTKIRFAGYQVDNAEAAVNGDCTDLTDIPWELDSPCYYGDDSDDVIYKGGNRGGYWDEKGSIRDAESGKNHTVVDVPTRTFTRSENTLYVDTTLYDYYSDYELNGNNRDNYDDVGIATHRIYQPFRQFNQALSQYYEKNNVTYPLYWGNFQNYNGAHYNDIADTLKLYGYDNKNQFFYENNSMWGSDGKEIAQAGKNATQGLAGESLSGGNLTLSGGVVAPFFNESFLAGDNSKNTVLGKVYHNVTFPFVKKALPSSADQSAKGTVDYWYFNSAENANEIANKNLQLQYDPVNGYFLQTANPVKGQTIGSGGNYPATADGNYFPFNTSNESGKACKLNYGFGQKIEFKFRLTKNGTVTTTTSKEVPIEFNFSGDDDVWVYIDGQLVLDVGGGHGVVDGRINFKDKTAWVSMVKNTSGGGFKTDVTKAFPDSFTNDKAFNLKEHTLTMFYMERGLWESNMKITFNMPDNNQLIVEKEVDTSNVDSRFKDVFDDADFPINIKNLATSGDSKKADTNGSEATGTITFTGTAGPATGFTVKQEDIPDYGSISAKILQNAWGARYTKYTADSSGQINGMVDSNGMFTLQNGQNVTFNDQFRRGSYVYLEESVDSEDSEVFDTFWTLYENGKEVTSMASGNKVDNPAAPQVVKQSGTVVNDGRTEKNFNESKPEKALLFRSYAYPDSDTTLIKLKAKYVNKVKVGGLTIKKTQGNGSDPLNNSYEFTIKFEYIAGFRKNIPDIQFNLKAGESKTFAGIPAGTRYTIIETAPTDGSTLENIKVTPGNDETSFSVSNCTVTGVITADTKKADYTVADFVNTKIPKIAIHVEKIWKNAGNSAYNGTLLPPIKVKLQRRVSDDAKWQDIEGIEVKELNAQGGWKCDFSGLYRYSNPSINSIEYQYRVVELDADGNNLEEDDTFILEEGGTFERFRVSYNSTSNTDNKSEEWKITNTYSPLTAIKVIKVDAATKEKLRDVEFKLEKINTKGSSPQNDEVDSNFKAVTDQTNSNGECIGECKFEKLENGLYRLTETKADANHNLLKSPVYITVNRAGDCLIDGSPCVVNNNTITLTIANSPKFELPATGSWSRLILGFSGAILIGMSVIMYLLQKRRKEGKTS